MHGHQRQPSSLTANGAFCDSQERPSLHAYPPIHSPEWIALFQAQPMVPKWRGGSRHMMTIFGTSTRVHSGSRRSQRGPWPWPGAPNPAETYPCRFRNAIPWCCGWMPLGARNKGGTEEPKWLRPHSINQHSKIPNSQNPKSQNPISWLPQGANSQCKDKFSHA